MFNNYCTKMKRNIILLLALIFCSFFACQDVSVKPPYEVHKTAIADTAMVVSAHPLASKIGIEIMKQGGNAVDAVVAVQFALAVVYPRAGNIGGGGFMVIRKADGTAAALDYREKAPLAADRDMYLDSLGNVIPDKSRVGHLAVGVPGTVAGMLAAQKKFGKLSDYKKMLEPAIRLASEGFKVTKIEADRLNRFREDFLKLNPEPIAFVKDGEWKEGDILVQKDLAHTLELIRDRGRDGFYAGTTANKIVAEMQRGNGIITLEDLAKYQPKWRTPITGFYKNYKIITMPPSSSGGIALMQLLDIIEDYPLAKWGFHSSQAVHLMVEAERRVFADRAEYLGDSDFYSVPTDSLLNKNYLKTRMHNFQFDKATPSDTILAGNFHQLVESFETTHTSVVDPGGNAVAVTTTLNLNYGSKVVVSGAGFLLNDEMDDFSAKPGVPNFFGLIGNEANAIQPQKRMLSSMTPTIVEKDGALFLVLGTPGGSTIITSVLQVFLNVAEFGMNLDEAVNAGRFHHQWLPDDIKYEKNGLDSLTRAKLEAMGYTLKEVNRMGVLKAIQILPNGKLNGVGDRRNPDDHAEGW